MDVIMMMTSNSVKNEESVENYCEMLLKKQGLRRSGSNSEEESVVKNLGGAEEIPS
jgi:hypothetical protein